MAATDVVRGIEHVGITVPDIEEATDFFVAAFGAEPMYDMHASPRATGGSGDPDASDQATLGVREGVSWLSSRMLRLGGGANIELFTYHDNGQRAAATASDLGIQHLALLVDDIDVASRLVVEAGGQALVGPSVLPGPEAGEGNKWLYTVAPWGTIIELISLPSPQAYETTTPLRRWQPAPRPTTQRDTGNEERP